MSQESLLASKSKPSIDSSSVVLVKQQQQHQQPTNNFGLYSGTKNFITYYPSYINNFTITEGTNELITIKNIDPSSITIDNSNNVFIRNTENITYNTSGNTKIGITYYSTSLIEGNIFSKINSIKQIQLCINGAISYIINSTTNLHINI